MDWDIPVFLFVQDGRPVAQTEPVWVFNEKFNCFPNADACKTQRIS